MGHAKIISISLSPDLSKEVSAIAKEERRSVSEVFREALRQYAALNAVSKVRKQAQKTAKKRHLTEEDIEDIIDEGRK